jgi:hypothetical protein
VVWVGFCVIGLSIGGFVFWRATHPSKKASIENVQLGAAGVGEVDGSNIPLNQARAAESNSGLQVNSGAAGSIGQLSGSDGQNISGGSNNSSSNQSSSSQGIDPTKFGEYEKYKNDQNSLFGDMQVGDGAELTANKKASVYYRGWLTNGQMFDQSRTGSDGKLQPFSFTLGAHQVISGWEQGLAGMKVGGVRLVIVPPAVGYGSQAQGSIPANSVLVFQVQLLAVE